MKVKELIAQLQKYEEFSPDMEVVMSVDSEGNEYNCLSEVTPFAFPEEELKKKYDLDTFTDDEGKPEGKKVVMLWPVN